MMDFDVMNAANRRKSILTEFQGNGASANNLLKNISIPVSLDSNAKGDFFILY